MPQYFFVSIQWGVLQWRLFVHPRFFFIPATWQSVSVSFRSLGKGSSRLPYLARRVPPPRFSAAGFLQRPNIMNVFSPPHTLVPGICWSPWMKVTLSIAGDQLMAAGRAVLFLLFPFYHFAMLRLTRHFSRHFDFILPGFSFP